MRLPVGVKVGAFALAVMGTDRYYANSIPQIQSKPPAELSLEGGNVTPAQLVKAGEEIFHTKGTCEICHRIGQKGTRAPDLAGIGARAGKTKPGMSAKQYIIESLLQPGAYIVEGRSEERRVGKECRSRWWPYREKKNRRRDAEAREARREFGKMNLGECAEGLWHLARSV